MNVSGGMADRAVIAAAALAAKPTGKVQVIVDHGQAQEQTEKQPEDRNPTHGPAASTTGSGFLEA